MKINITDFNLCRDCSFACVITSNCSSYAESLGKRLVNSLELAKNPNPFSVTEVKRTMTNPPWVEKKNLGKNEGFKKLFLINIKPNSH